MFNSQSIQYTQSGNIRFLAYIPSRWKNQPWLVRVEVHYPHPLTLFTITHQVAVYAPAEGADSLSLFHLYPEMYSLPELTRVMADGVQTSMLAEELADSGVLVGTPKDDNETEAADGSEPPAILDAVRRGGGAATGDVASRRTRSLSTRSCRLFICFFRVISACGAAEPALE
jgi:hypothetical protein